MLARKMRPLRGTILWIAVAALGAAAFAVLALSRGESINAAWILVAGVASYVIAYRFYSRFLAFNVFGLDDRRATPAERLNNGRDFVPTTKWVLYGHHFAAIAGAGPLIGPMLAAQFGYLPGTLWLIAGVVRGRRRAGLHHPVRLDAPRREVARPDGEGRGELGRGHGRDGRHPRDHDHPAGGARAGRGQRAAGEPLGAVHHREHHPHRHADGRVDAELPPRARARGLRDRHRAPAGRPGGRPVRGARPHLVPLVHLVGHRAVVGDHRVRVLRRGAPGLAAALAAGLPLDLPQDRHHPRAGRGHPPGAAPDPPARADAVRGRQRTGVLRQGVPVRVHHHRLRRDLGLPRAGGERHHAEDGGARERGPADRLRRHADGVVRGPDGDHRGRHARARRSTSR